MIAIDSSNLSKLKLSSLFESTLSDTTPLEFNVIHIPKAQVEKITETLVAVGVEIDSKVTLLVSPFDAEGRYEKLEVEQEMTASSNDEIETTRWTGKSLKFLIRKVPESAVS